MSRAGDKKQRKRQKRIHQKRSRETARADVTDIRRRLESAKHLFPSMFAEIIKLPWEHAQRMLSIALERPKLQAAMIPSPFPSVIADLGVKSNYRLTHTLCDELYLCLGAIIFYKEDIITFLRSSRDFERSILLGEFETARMTRDTLIASHGVSMWSIETGLLVGELEGGVEGNREALSEVQDQLKSPYLGFVSSFLSQRIEATVSVSGYDSALRLSTDEVGDDIAMQPLLADIFCRLNYHHFRHHTHLWSVLHVAREFSVFDLYESFVRLLSILASNDTNATHQAILADVLPRACSHFDDPRLHILSSVALAKSPLFRDELTDSLCDICDQYTRGEYKVALQASLALLPLHPECLELYELAARAAVNGRLPAPSLGSDSSVSSALLENVYDVFARNDKAPTAAAVLLKLGYALDVTSIGHRLVGFWQDHADIPHTLGTRTFRAITSTRVTPWCARAASGARNIRLQAKLASAYPKSISVSLHRNGTPPLEAVPRERQIRFAARAFESKGDIDGALSQYRELQRLACDQHHVRHAAVVGIIRCMMLQHRFLEAADETVDAFLSPGTLIWGEIEHNLGPLIATLLSIPPRLRKLAAFGWPLFVQICIEQGSIEPNPRDLFAAYDDELRRHEVQRPSQLFVNTPSEHLLGFLRLVCVPDVLRRSYRLKSVGEMEQERVFILQYLLKHDTRIKAAVTDEIAALTKKAILRDAVQHVESSLIYVNAEGVQRGLGQEHVEMFQRFSRIVAIEDVRLRKQLKLDSLKLKMVLTLEDLGFSLFRDLFLRIRDAFVTSKADGLNTYLSMRIRHGTLSGRLRGNFERLHLLARRVDAHGDYARNEYWADRLMHLGAAAVDAIDHSLRVFSSDVDEIIDEVNNSWIRVKSDPDGLGMFDYTYHEPELGSYYAALAPAGGTTLQYQEFVEECMRLLWRRTELLLSAIRARIGTEVRDRMSTALAKTEEAIASAWPACAQSDLGVPLTTARTTIQRDAQAVALWFTMPTHRSMPPFGFQLLIDTAAEMVRRLHPDRKFWPALVAVGDWENVEIRGNLFTSFFNMYFILFDNIIKHGLESANTPRLGIVVSAEQLTISVENNIAIHADPQLLADTIAKINDLRNRKTEDLRLQTEGRSGFEKLHNIVRNELRRNEYRIDVSHHRQTASMCLSR